MTFVKGYKGTISDEKKKEHEEELARGDGSWIGKDGKIRRPSMKMRKFVRRVIETNNPTQAAMEVYNTTDRANARAYASKVMGKKSIQILLNKYISDAEVLQTVKDQLKATTFKGKEADVEMADNMARLKAADIALKLKGAYPTDAMKLNVGGGNQINFIVTKMESKDEIDVNNLTEEKDDTT